MTFNLSYNGTPIRVTLEKNALQTAIAIVGETATTHGTWARKGARGIVFSFPALTPETVAALNNQVNR